MTLIIGEDCLNEMIHELMNEEKTAEDIKEKQFIGYHHARGRGTHSKQILNWVSPGKRRTKKYTHRWR